MNWTLHEIDGEGSFLELWREITTVSPFLSSAAAQ
jgi:hypothetical protein